MLQIEMFRGAAFGCYVVFLTLPYKSTYKWMELVDLTHIDLFVWKAYIPIKSAVFPILFPVSCSVASFICSVGKYDLFKSIYFH